MKSYTDLEQSKKLAEILPLDSADMYYDIVPAPYTQSEIPELKESQEVIKDTDLPCWSLAALLSVLPNSIFDNTDEYSQLEFSRISVAYHDMNDGIKVGSIKDNLVDACYEMILKLHEQKLL